MFTQLFGFYLLNNKIVTPPQLQEALAAKSKTKARLGALAIDAGYMTAEQVEKVHDEQKRVDKRIGDIAVGMGYLKEEQVDELLSKQKTSDIIIGQTLIDLGYLTNQQFADALAGYKAVAVSTDDDKTDEKLSADISSFLGLNGLKGHDYYAEYVVLLAKNLIRFVGDDFAFSGCKTVCDTAYPRISEQDITGAQPTFTAIAGCDKCFAALASRYAEEELTDPEYIQDGVSELLNTQNGLFAVNLSVNKDIELGLTPPTFESNKKLDIAGGIAVTMTYSFGTVDFVVLKK